MKALFMLHVEPCHFIKWAKTQEGDPPRPTDSKSNKARSESKVNPLRRHQAPPQMWMNASCCGIRLYIYSCTKHEQAIHINSNITAEMWSVRDWLWVAGRFGFPHLTIETDSVFVYNALFRKQVQAAQLKRMLHAVQVQVSKFSSVQVTFYYR